MGGTHGTGDGKPDRRGRRHSGGAPVSLGSAYHLAVIDGVCTAWRKDCRGGKLADRLPEGLRLQIMADYERMPVPRDLP
jgi:hypothetical protein